MYTGGIYKGAEGGKSAYKMEFQTELGWSAGAYLVHMRCVS